MENTWKGHEELLRGVTMATAKWLSAAGVVLSSTTRVRIMTAEAAFSDGGDERKRPRIEVSQRTF